MKPSLSSVIDLGLMIADTGIARFTRNGPYGTFVVKTTVVASLASTFEIPESLS